MSTVGPLSSSWASIPSPHQLAGSHHRPLLRTHALLCADGDVCVEKYYCPSGHRDKVGILWKEVFTEKLKENRTQHYTPHKSKFT